MSGFGKSSGAVGDEGSDRGARDGEGIVVGCTRGRSAIEIELVDDQGEPVADERYEIRLANGKVRRGKTDANGVALVDAIPDGECDIGFPDLDAALVKPLGSVPR